MSSQNKYTMDDPWRSLRNGLNLNLQRRRSTEETSSDLIRRAVFASQTTLQPEDFHDVFGGPPRTLVYQKLSADFAPGNGFIDGDRDGAGSSAFYEDIFRSSDSGDTVKRGRNLPVFRIPAEAVDTRDTVRGRDSRCTEDFYIDIFGADHQEDQKWRSKSRSKSTTSSVLSSEDRSPLRPSAADDPFFSSFSSRLRPINVPHRPNRSPSMTSSRHKMRGSPEFAWNHHRSREFHFTENEHYKSNHFWFPRSGSSPETISLEPSSYRSLKASPVDQETESPTSSVVSSLCQESDIKVKFLDKALDEQEQEVMSSFVIELTSDRREVRDESVAIDEAIAWAKEKFQSRSLEATEIEKQQQQIVKPSHVTADQPFEYSEDLSERSISHQLSNGRGDTSMVDDDSNSLWSQKA